MILLNQSLNEEERNSSSKPDDVKQRDQEKRKHSYLFETFIKLQGKARVTTSSLYSTQPFILS